MNCRDRRFDRLEEKTNGRIGHASASTSSFAETNGTWGVEGHGDDPGIEVVDGPALMVDGGDLQLDAAIEHRLAESERIYLCLAAEAGLPRPKRRRHSGGR